MSSVTSIDLANLISEYLDTQLEKIDNLRRYLESLTKDYTKAMRYEGKSWYTEDLISKIERNKFYISEKERLLTEFTDTVAHIGEGDFTKNCNKLQSIMNEIDMYG